MKSSKFQFTLVPLLFESFNISINKIDFAVRSLSRVPKVWWFFFYFLTRLQTIDIHLIAYRTDSDKIFSYRLHNFRYCGCEISECTCHSIKFYRSLWMKIEPFEECSWVANGLIDDTILHIVLYILNTLKHIHTK